MHLSLHNRAERHLFQWGEGPESGEQLCNDKYYGLTKLEIQNPLS